MRGMAASVSTADPMADSAIPSASQRTIRESPASPTSRAIAINKAPRAIASTPLLPSSSPSAAMVSVTSMVSGLGVATRAALVLAAVCGASVLAVDQAVCPDGPTAAPSTKPPVGPPSVEPRELLLDLYTRGPLLDTVQRAGLFNDSKHFVDMPIKANSTATTILSEFQTMVQPAIMADPAAINQTLRTFLGKHFDEPGSETQKTVPADFTESPAPPRIAAIQNAGYQKWALALHALWKELGRSPSRTIASSYLQPKPLASLGDTSTSTLIVVPGGRFRESYYWDSYWIVEGLMVSNMQATARRVVQNLLEYVAEFGFVPNGGRLYYLTRSQPPLLSDMVRLVATKTNQSPGQGQGQGQGQGGSKPTWDVDYLRAVVPLLEKEYDYWMTHHAIQVNTLGIMHTLNLYNSTVGEPRPESYREDVKLAEAFFPNDVSRQQQLYGEIRAAAESGWDFSSRWFTDQTTLATIATNKVVPVDLNAILYRVESNLAEFNTLLGNDAASATFTEAATKRARALEMVFWHEPSASWRDILLRANSTAFSPVVSVSNYYPLWAGGFRGANASVDLPKRLDRIVQSLQNSGLIQVAGVQTTTRNTTQQWDAPNAWPPLQDILIEGLLKVDTTNSRALAKELVQKWIDTGFAAWTKSGLMFEKYDATLVGGLGAGGEYEPQFGFGWTNGVVLKFLTEYPDLLK